MLGSIGFPELIMIFLVVLLLFGPDKLPDFAKTLGNTIKEFRKTVNEAKSTIAEEIEKADLAEEIKSTQTQFKQITKIDVDNTYETGNEPKN